MYGWSILHFTDFEVLSIATWFWALLGRLRG